MKIFQTPIGAPAAPGEVSYADANKKFTDAEQKFSAVASKYPHTRASELSRYYEGLSFEKLDKNADAKGLLQGLTSSSDDEVAAMAQFELGGLDDRMGQGAAAGKLS